MNTTTDFDKMLSEVPYFVKWYKKKYGVDRDTEELIQDVYIRLLKYPPDLSKWKISTVVIKVISQVLYIYTKKKTLNREILIEDPKYEDNKHLLETSIDIESIFQHLDKKDREFLQSYYGINKPLKKPKEIAKTLKVTKQAVSLRHKKIIYKIQEQFCKA